MKKFILFLTTILLFLIPIPFQAAVKEGFVRKNGDLYLYSNGVLQKGITEYQGNWYFLGEITGKLQIGWVTSFYSGKTYHTNQEGIIETGFKEIEGNVYYFNNDLKKGITEISGENYFLGEYSGKVQKGLVTSSLTGETYYADNSGKLESGFRTINGDTYYFNPNIQKGITEISGEKYFLGEYSGKVQRGLVTSSLTGETYYADNNGKLESGFKEVNGDTYYFNPTMQKGITEINGEKYFLGEYSGKVQKGLVRSSLTKKYYYTDESGKIYIGNFEINGEEYSSYDTGVLKEGFQKEEDNTYYFEKGKKVKGPYEVNNKLYFFGEVTGKLQYGWITAALTGYKYYADTNGVLKQGIQKIDDKLYFFGEVSGRLQYGWIHSLSRSVYYATEEGIILTGDQIIDNKEYHFGEDGRINSGFLTLGDNTYYISSNGKKLTGVHKIHGVRYRFDSEGKMTDSNFKLIADISYYQGNINWDALWASKEIDGVILRIGYSSILDSNFESYIANVKRLNIPYSVYLFSYAHNAREALLEGYFTVDQIRKYNLQLSMPVYYDIESWRYRDGSESSDDISPKTYEEIIGNYIWALNANSYEAKVYTGWYYARDRLTATSRQYVDWIAHYTSNSCGYQEPHSGWQYTSSGRVTGINGDVDLSIFY